MYKIFWDCLRKIIARGFFYTIKIESYKVIYDKKYNRSKLKKIVIFIIKLIAKNTKLKQPKFILKTLEIDNLSFSQLGQDTFVLEMLTYRTGGFFIEIGAGDGMHLSNTYLLEKHFNWNGILIEPNKSFYNMCRNLRTCKIINRILLDSNLSRIKFYEKINGEFSHSEGYGNVLASEIREMYEIESIKFDEIFDDLLNIPKIDFLSIDTEGSEVEILRSIDFSIYKPKIICIEHNFNKKNRMFFKEHLTSNGYKLTYPGISRWDSWFVEKSI